MQDFNSFSKMFYYISGTTYQKIGDLFCPVNISVLLHSVVGLQISLQTSELVDEVTCIVDGNHSFYVSSIKTSLFFNLKKEINEIC